MKITLTFMQPIQYDGQAVVGDGNVRIISNGDTIGMGDGSSGVFDAFRPKDLVYNSICSGINFRTIFAKEFPDLTVTDYYMASAYRTSKTGLRIMKPIMEKAGPRIRVLCPSLDTLADQVQVYEYASKTDPADMVIVIAPKQEKYEVEVMCVKVIWKHEFDIKSEAGIDFLTESLYISDPAELKELVHSLSPTMTAEINDALEKYDPKVMFGMWDWASIQGRNVGYDFEQTPWKKALDDMKDDMLKILRSPVCSFIRTKRLERTLKKYIGGQK